MVKVDAIEGVVDGVLWCHYDLTDDVLYLRLMVDRNTSTLAEETPDGLVLERREDDKVVGITIVSWWKRFGSGSVPDSIRVLEQAIKPWAKRLAG